MLTGINPSRQQRARVVALIARPVDPLLRLFVYAPGQRNFGVGT